MKELSLHLLDIAQNSIVAGASEIEMILEEQQGRYTLTIRDNGCGMSPEMLRQVTDPFCTSRSTRKVGLGLPLLRLACEQTGGALEIESEPGVGTAVTASFDAAHIDCPPLGDMAGTVSILVQGAPDVDFTYLHIREKKRVHFDTREVREILGQDISLAEPEVAAWIAAYIREQEA